MTNGDIPEPVENWPFKTDNDKEALELGRAILMVLSQPGANVFLTRKKYYMTVDFRTSSLGREFSATQSAWNGATTLAESLKNGYIKAQLANEQATK